MGGVRFDALTASQVVARVVTELRRGRGGTITTPDVDVVRQTRRRPDTRDHVTDTAVVLPGGAPLVWASRLARTGLPERVAAADLVWKLCEAAAADRRRVFLLGGTPGGERSTACLAAQRLATRYGRLHVAGACSPPVGFDSDPEVMAALRDELTGAQPDIVCVGLGFPKQEQIIAALAPSLPHAWFLGCGSGLDYVAGLRRRAPLWMRQGGLEWLHRLACEPRRLFGRYVVHGIPAVGGILVQAAWQRFRPR